MERQIKGPDDNGEYRKSRLDSSSPSPKVDRKTPIDFITLSPGMRLSDGPPARSNNQPSSKIVSKPQKSPQPPLPKNSGPKNPFASFMPLSTREREARLSLSDDEISSTIDTFSPIDQPDIPRTISGSISNIIPPTVPRSKRRDATAKVKAPVRAIHEIDAEQLVPLDSTAPPVKPLTSNQAILTRNLIIIASVLLVLGVGGAAYMMLTMDDPMSPTKSALKHDQESNLSAEKASLSLSDKNETHKTSPENTEDSKIEVAKALFPKVADESPPQAATQDSQSKLVPTKAATKDSVFAALPEIIAPKRDEQEDAPADKNDDVKKTAQKEETASTVPADSPEMVIIKLTGLPRDAAITVNGRAMDSPFEVPRSLKALKVVVNAPDYETAVKRIVPGQDKAVLVRMKRK